MIDRMEHGRKCIEMPKELIAPRMICMKGMKGSLKGQANHCVYMNLTLVEGTWPFLHLRSLYRGIGLVSSPICDFLYSF